MPRPEAGRKNAALLTGASSNCSAPSPLPVCRRRVADAAARCGRRSPDSGRLRGKPALRQSSVAGRRGRAVRAACASRLSPSCLRASRACGAVATLTPRHCSPVPAREASRARRPRRREMADGRVRDASSEHASRPTVECRTSRRRFADVLGGARSRAAAGARIPPTADVEFGTVERDRGGRPATDGGPRQAGGPGQEPSSATGVHGERGARTRPPRADRDHGAHDDRRPSRQARRSAGQEPSSADRS